MVDGAPSGMLTNFATRLTDLEERLNTLKERIMLLSETFLKERERSNNEITSLKRSIMSIQETLEKIKEGLEHIINESAGFARKEELSLIERQMRLWEPLKFVKGGETKRIGDETLKRKRR